MSASLDVSQIGKIIEYLQFCKTEMCPLKCILIYISKKLFLFVDVILIVVVNATPTCLQPGTMTDNMSSMMGSNGILPPLFFLALSILQIVSIVTENELPMMVRTVYKTIEI